MSSPLRAQVPLGFLGFCFDQTLSCFTCNWLSSGRASLRSHACQETCLVLCFGWCVLRLLVLLVGVVASAFVCVFVCVFWLFEVHVR